MATPQIVDELIVTLSLDAESYQQAEKKIERETGRTFRKQQDRARQTDRTVGDQQKRLKSLASGVKGFAVMVAGAVGVVAGLGVAVNGALSGLLGFETGLRRQAVGTGMSNRQMQAWSATARRLGADANAGAEAMANLAREQKLGLVTGNAPTMQALARIGVDINPNRAIEDILGDAQNRYRNAPEGQRQQIETSLLASGVSVDLVLMIKSEIDARDAYTRSFAQSAEENRKALDQLADSYESIKASGISVAATLLTALQPAIERGAERLGEFAIKVAEFARDVEDAGGGVAGLQAALDKHVPQLAASLQVMGDVTAVVVDQLQLFWQSLKDLGTWVRYFLNFSRAPWGSKPLGTDLGERISAGGSALADWWKGRVASARAGSAGGMDAVYGRNLDRAADPMTGVYSRNLERSSGGANAQELMSMLTSQYGLSVSQAAAVAANWQRESGLNPGAFNGAGGGTGARGLAQWRGARTDAFRQRYGVMPDRATIAQQVEFAMTDPYEKALMAKAFAAGGSAEQLGASYSRIYEAHGNTVEDARRGTMASQLAGTQGRPINIENMTVNTDSPTEFAQGLQRLDTTQPYNTVVR